MRLPVDPGRHARLRHARLRHARLRSTRLRSARLRSTRLRSARSIGTSAGSVSGWSRLGKSPARPSHPVPQWTIRRADLVRAGRILEGLGDEWDPEPT
ncbi:pentapeptide repeat-containing protein [Kitasatospora sp. NPDC057738]|uniref:pentapeptide repeat-containing protein n=1 Tax=Kitasatospora sp. NPDC057738 TaxID=3346233 RepID=UPI0036B5F697